MLRNEMGADKLSKKQFLSWPWFARDPAGYTGENRRNVNMLHKCKHTVGRGRRLRAFAVRR